MKPAIAAISRNGTSHAADTYLNVDGRCNLRALDASHSDSSRSFTDNES
jgi:hypothetical protein